MMRSKLHRIIRFVFTLICGFCSSVLFSQVKVEAKLDSASILIGQQTKLDLIVQYRLDDVRVKIVKFPEVADTIRKEIDVVNHSKVDSVFDSNDIYALTLRKSYYITSFDSGYWAIPPFKFVVNNDTNGVFTEPLLLQVQTVAVDTTQNIKNIKPILVTQYSFIDWIKDNMIYVYIIVGTVLLVIIVVYLSRKYNKMKMVVKEVVKQPEIPAHIIALKKLNEIKSQSVWQQGKTKHYYSLVSETIREYIENRYRIPALEQTTEEIIYGFRNVALDEQSMSKLKQILKISDLVKFAKENPLPAENEQTLINAFDFVEDTKVDDDQKETGK